MAYEAGYLLTKDLRAERVASRFAGLRTSRKAVDAQRGELLVVMPSQDLVPRKDGKKPHNYRLARDTTVTVRAEEEEVALLDQLDHFLLEAITCVHCRFTTFTSANKLKWGRSLTEDREVFVVMNQKKPQTAQLYSRAVIRWVGVLGIKERGTVFGVEIMDEAHRGQGTTDGIFLSRRLFTCDDNCGMFVALDRLSWGAGLHSARASPEKKKKVRSAQATPARGGPGLETQQAAAEKKSFQNAQASKATAPIPRRRDPTPMPVIAANSRRQQTLPTGHFHARPNGRAITPTPRGRANAPAPRGYDPTQIQSHPQPSASEQHDGHPQHQQRAGQPPSQPQKQPAGSSHLSRVVQATLPGHNPTRILGIGSKVQVSDPPLYGVLRWIGVMPATKGVMAGLDMEEPVKGYSDGSWKGARLFQCQPRRGFFCPLTALRPDGRFTPKGATAIPNPLADWPMSEMADQTALDIDVERYLGEGRGIQGNQNSCFLVAIVFGLFAVSDVFDHLFLPKPGADEDDQEIADILWKGIVNPLRENAVVMMESVVQLREKLKELGKRKGVNQDMKDPEEFLNMLFKHVLHVEPFVTIKRPFGAEWEYFVKLLFQFDERAKIPTVGFLLRKMFLEADITFTKAPCQLLIRLPRYGKKFKTYDMIVPELFLDVGELLPSYKCIICREPTRIKCDVCHSRFRSEAQDGSVYFCIICDKRAHMTQKTQGHARIKEWSPSRLRLLSVICIETSHYVCFTRADDEQWIFFDSMANGVYDQYNTPRGVDCTRLLNEWVYTEDQSRLLSTPPREMPEFVRRFTQDIYMCVYINPDVSMY